MSLAQYYTNQLVSNHLISQVRLEKPNNVLDIGCGQSSLLLAAGKRWSYASLIGFDIDPKNTASENAKLQLHHGNGLDPDLWKKIIDKFGYIDVAVSNPPYLSVEYNSAAKSILKSIELDQYLSQKLKLVPSELIFLAQNLLVIKEHAELGIILPAGLISGERWATVRTFLTSNYTIDKCTQLPINTFEKTEASTFALCLTNKLPDQKKIQLNDLLIEKAVNITKEQAISRMDYLFYSSTPPASNMISLKKHPLKEIFRGNYTVKSLKKMGCYFLHTSSFKNEFSVLNIPNVNVPEGIKHAQKGDIIISRVGSRCVGQTAFIKSGCAPVSDCVFVIRTNNNADLWNIMKNGGISDFLKNSSIGVGAKYITMSMLKGMFNASNL